MSPGDWEGSERYPGLREEVAPCSWGQIVAFKARIDAGSRRPNPRDIFHSLPLGSLQNLPPPPHHFGVTSKKDIVT